MITTRNQVITVNIGNKLGNKLFADELSDANLRGDGIGISALVCRMV